MPRYNRGVSDFSDLLLMPAKAFLVGFAGALGAGFAAVLVNESVAYIKKPSQKTLFDFT